MSTSVIISEQVAESKSRAVALESAVIATGLPFPKNLEAAFGCEEVIAAAGGVPATIAVLEGIPTIGCSKEQIKNLAQTPGVKKTNLSNLAAVVAERCYGATTVSATMHLATSVGIKVFSTGGIGGVHKDAEVTFDISADLTALTRYPMVVVCAGAKSILDLPRTVELLETLGIPIVGYCSDCFPAFYSRDSGIKLDIVAETPREVANIAKTHWELGLNTAILVALPIPQDHEIPQKEVNKLLSQALDDANQQGIRGKALTPFLLSRLKELSSGKTLEANLLLLKNNARLAAEIAVCLSEVHC